MATKPKLQRGMLQRRSKGRRNANKDSLRQVLLSVGCLTFIFNIWIHSEQLMPFLTAFEETISMTATYEHKQVNTAAKESTTTAIQATATSTEGVSMEASTSKLKGEPKASEAWGYKEYFETYLQGTVRNRTDGLHQARFGKIVSFMEADYGRNYHAMIGISCDSYNFLKWMRSGANNYCVLHGTCPSCNEEIRNRSCWLNPQFPDCFYIPSDYPQFFEHDAPAPTTINICVTGGGKSRTHDLLSEALAALQPNDVRLHLFARKQFSRGSGIGIPYPEYHQRNVTHLVRMVQEVGFEAYQRAVSRCHVGLPLVDPVRNKSYFGNGLKKLTGSLPQIIAYKLPSVMHVELDRIYHEHLTAPVEVYSNTEEFIQGLSRTLELVRQSRGRTGPLSGLTQNTRTQLTIS